MWLSEHGKAQSARSSRRGSAGQPTAKLHGSSGSNSAAGCGSSGTVFCRFVGFAAAMVSPAHQPNCRLSLQRAGLAPEIMKTCTCKGNIQCRSGWAVSAAHLAWPWRPRHLRRCPHQRAPPHSHTCTKQQPHEQPGILEQRLGTQRQSHPPCEKQQTHDCLPAREPTH